MSFGDAPSLRPGVGCGDKGGCQTQQGGCGQPAPTQHHSPRPWGLLESPPRSQETPPDFQPCKQQLPEPHASACNAKPPASNQGLQGHGAWPRVLPRVTPPQARPVTSVPSQAHSRGCLTRLCLRDNPRPPRWQLGSRSSAQARAAPGFCPRGVEIQTTSPPRGRAAAGAAVMNEGRDKNQAGRGRGGTHKGMGHKKPLFACACAEPALLLRGAQHGSLHPRCPESCLWHLGGSQGVPSLQGQGPSTAAPQPRAPVWPLPSTAPLLAPTPPPQQLRLGAATCMESHGDARRLRPSGKRGRLGAPADPTGTPPGGAEL